jgi:hypothetical protein
MHTRRRMQLLGTSSEPAILRVSSFRNKYITTTDTGAVHSVSQLQENTSKSKTIIRAVMREMQAILYLQFKKW